MKKIGRLLASFLLLCLYTHPGAASAENISTLCPLACSYSLTDGLLTVYCRSYKTDREQRIDSVLSSNLTYNRLCIGYYISHIPRSVCRQTTLTQLHLDNNRLTRLPDNCLTNLTALKSLSASRNNITELQDALFKKLHKLTVLDVSFNRITELRDGLFDGLDRLETLKLSYNQIKKLQDGLLDRLHKLDTLSIHNNDVSSIGHECFADFSI